MNQKLAWDDVSHMNRVTIDRRTKHLIHLSCGSYRYNFGEFSDSFDAVMADYRDNPTDDQLRESFAIMYHGDDVEDMVQWFKQKHNL